MPLRYNVGVPPQSSRFLPPGSDYADQFSETSCRRHGDTPAKKERWQSQSTSYMRPETERFLTTNSVTWAGAFNTAVKPQPESLPHHSCHFYKDHFHILGEQDKEMGKYGHDMLSGYENPHIVRQTKLTAGLREDNEDVGTFTRRRGKVLRDVPLCLMSTRLAEPFPKPTESGGLNAGPNGSVITDTLANRPIARQRRDLSLPLGDKQDSALDSPANMYPTFKQHVMDGTKSSTLGCPDKGLTRGMYPWETGRVANKSSGSGLVPASAYKG